MYIKTNLGTVDRALRISISGAMVYIGFFDHSIVTDELAEMILGVFGVAILISAIIGNCPLYDLIGLNTCKSNNNVVKE